MKTQLGRNRYVKINPGRGYNNDWYLIIGESQNVYQLRNEVDKSKVTIYKTHCTTPTFVKR